MGIYTRNGTVIFPLESREGKIADEFSRANFFVVKPLNGKVGKVLPNPYKNSTHQTAMKVLRMLLTYNPKVVYARRIGVNMRRLLEQYGIKVIITAEEWL